jgi:hypothetical protein
LDNDIFRTVRFDKYCDSCKYKDLKDFFDPCNDCLGIGMRENSEKPEYYEEATAEDLRKRKKNKP